MELNDYNIINRIGEGAYSNVYKIIHQGEYKALKRIPINDHFNPLEFHILTQFQRGHILQSQSIIYDEKNINIILPLATMDLHYWIKYFYSPELSCIDEWIIQLLVAVNQLHCHGIIHGDIKPDNILVFGKDLYLGDFSLSLKQHEKGNLKTIATIHYRPLECFTIDYVDYRVDIWSLACVLYKLKRGKYLFPIQRSNDEYLSCLIAWHYEYKVDSPYLIVFNNHLHQEFRRYSPLDLKDPFDTMIFTMLKDRINIDKVFEKYYQKEKIDKVNFTQNPSEVNLEKHTYHLYEKCKHLIGKDISELDIRTACIFISSKSWYGRMDPELYLIPRSRLYKITLMICQELAWNLF
jgi:serine/threonine protein kinase